MDIWPWLTSLPTSDEWPPSDSPLVLQLANSSDKSILLKAERTAGSDSEALVTFTVCLQGFHPSNPTKTLWVSNPCPLLPTQTHSFHPLLLQLLREVIGRAPSLPDGAPPPAIDLREVGDSPQFPGFFGLVFLCRLFWLCACDAPADVGSLFFQTLNGRLHRLLDCKKAVRVFLISAGVDWEVYFMRALGYMLAKWCLLSELSPPGSTGSGSLGSASFSYTADLPGLWVLKGYVPVQAMTQTNRHHQAGYPNLEARESVRQYALAHQQLEAVVQLEYSVCMQDHRFIRVRVRVDNIRLHVVRLGFGSRDQMEESSGPVERHFPSRVRVWVGPELGSACVSGLSLGRSTGNPEREVERQQTVKGSFGNSKFPEVRATARSSARDRARSWRWEQDAEGNLAVFEGVLCDGASNAEVAERKPAAAVAGGKGDGGMRRRYAGAGRAFSKAGGLVVAGDDFGEWVSWRVRKEMEGRVMRWRLGGKVWVSYWPNELRSSYFETRCVEWSEEVELPLVAM